MNEYYNVEKVEVFIIEALIKCGRVVIPDFGYLELRSLKGKHTVLFKQDETCNTRLQTVLMLGKQDQKDVSALYAVISTPLKEGRIVTLPQIGVFRPAKRESGKCLISFIPSSFLNKWMDENDKEFREEVKEIEIQKHVEPENGLFAAPIPNLRQKEKVKEPSFKPVSVQPYRKYKASDIIIQQDIVDNSGSRKKIAVISLLIVVILTVIVGVFFIMPQKKENANEQRVLTLPRGSVSLPTLAEQHYGHPAYWIYIYYANSDKLNSPVNIPQNVALVIPDLKTEYNVDVTDSAEIQRATVLAEIVLKEKGIK